MCIKWPHWVVYFLIRKQLFFTAFFFFVFGLDERLFEQRIALTNSKKFIFLSLQHIGVRNLAYQGRE